MSWATSHIERLREGEPVSFRPKGNSMRPKINSGDLVTVSPDVSDVSVGDVVLCKVRGRQYLHFVKAIRGRGECKSYLIGNNHGGINGWTTAIFGKLVEV